MTPLRPGLSGPHSPRARRRGGLDGADAQAVGRVLQGLQLLLVRLVVAFHGAAGAARMQVRGTEGAVAADCDPGPRGGALRSPGPAHGAG